MLEGWRSVVASGVIRKAHGLWTLVRACGSVATLKKYLCNDGDSELALIEALSNFFSGFMRVMS